MKRCYEETVKLTFIQGNTMQELPSDKVPWLKAHYAKSQSKSTLDGLTLQISPIKNVQIKNISTGRWITYAGANYEKYKNRISSSYVSIHHTDTTSTMDPQFGQIVRLYSHIFLNETTIICEVNILSSSNYDSELEMWYTSDNIEMKRYFVLEEVSYPLVVSIEKETSRIWFINYSNNRL